MTILTFKGVVSFSTNPEIRGFIEVFLTNRESSLRIRNMGLEKLVFTCEICEKSSCQGQSTKFHEWSLAFPTPVLNKFECYSCHISQHENPTIFFVLFAYRTTNNVVTVKNPFQKNHLICLKTSKLIEYKALYEVAFKVSTLNFGYLW